MLVEVRKILFPLEDLQNALLDECADEGIEAPNSQLQGLKIDGEESPKVTLQFMTAHEETPVEVPLSQQFVLTAMVRSCIEQHVPLPRFSKKSYKKHDTGLALIVALKIPALESTTKAG